MKGIHIAIPFGDFQCLQGEDEEHQRWVKWLWVHIGGAYWSAVSRLILTEAVLHGSDTILSASEEEGQSFPLERADRPIAKGKRNNRECLPAPL